MQNKLNKTERLLNFLRRTLLINTNTSIIVPDVDFGF